MCGILAILGSPNPNIRSRAIELGSRIRHRGPDWSGCFVRHPDVLVHQRLAICGIESGAQPILAYDESGEVVAAMAVNGEIYNEKSLHHHLSPDTKFTTDSDCEIILHLYLQYDIRQTLEFLRGMYSFVIVDYRNNRRKWVAARDHVGITPLYRGVSSSNIYYFASEMKAIIDDAEKLEIFEPGTFEMMEESEHTTERFYSLQNKYPTSMLSVDTITTMICERLNESVRSHMMGDVPWGVLLSGGLDSSLIAGLAAKYSTTRVDSDVRDLGDSQTDHSPWFPIHTFAIGLHNSPDLKAAEHVARKINSRHHTFEFTIQEGLDALPDVIHHTETYDITTIRASTPMYLLARRVKAMGIKMVLSGEGADEIFGGYLYFAKAPNPQEFHDETVRKVNRLHLYDCLRANKSMAAWGVEARVPYLSRDFLDSCMELPPEIKMISEDRPIEKWILRKTFDGASIIPDDILWRQKEQFSDGVGYGWIDGLKDHSENTVTDEEFSRAEERFPINTPLSKEGYLYRKLFENYFPTEDAIRTVPCEKSCACSSEIALKWDENFTLDPSGRATKTHHQGW